MSQGLSIEKSEDSTQILVHLGKNNPIPEVFFEAYQASRGNGFLTFDPADNLARCEKYQAEAACAYSKMKRYIALFILGSVLLIMGTGFHSPALLKLFFGAVAVIGLIFYICVFLKWGNRHADLHQAQLEAQDFLLWLRSLALAVGVTNGWVEDLVILVKDRHSLERLVDARLTATGMSFAKAERAYIALDRTDRKILRKLIEEADAWEILLKSQFSLFKKNGLTTAERWTHYSNKAETLLRKAAQILPPLPPPPPPFSNTELPG